MKNIFKWVGIVFGCLILLGIFLPKNSKESTTSTKEASSSNVPDIEIINTSESLTKGTNTRYIHVKVKNNTNKLVSYIDLKGVYYDNTGKVVGTGIGNATNIASGATKTIDIISLGIDNPEKYEVEIGNTMYE